MKHRCTVLLGCACWAAIAAGCDEKHPPLASMPAPAVEVARPVVRQVEDYQIFTARTQAVQSVDLKARVTGYLTGIRFKDGDMVKEGQILFEIDDRPYKAALDQAKGQLEYAKAALVKAQADYDIGVAVRKDNPGAISEQELTRRLGARDEAKGGIDRAKGALENAQLNYDWCKVRSPLTGQATRHLVDIGNIVNQDTTNLVNIVSLKPMWAYINVDQNTAQQLQTLVRAGKMTSFRTGKVPVEMGVGVGSEQRFPFHGVIDYISNQLDPNTGSIQARAVFANDDLRLAAGLFARIRVPTSAPHEALLVNDQAVGTNQGQKYVLVVNDKDEVDYRAVDVKQIHSGLREVLPKRTVTEPGPHGEDITREVQVLSATDRVIVLGLQRARPGDKVQARLVDMQTLLPVSGTDKNSTPPDAPK